MGGWVDRLMGVGVGVGSLQLGMSRGVCVGWALEGWQLL